ncbi:MAG: tryptophanase [Candidatus Eisenbacteria bacterium]|uniref:Tryptophanase n=1 Tax=Eiseniibacteriota bacterium TaxID=2212470 RepID=A0A948RU69_UNCEI|nr:tryptophanase [Candidatus Eisenbacteria bacterium]MBU1948693.1 tryptophanase [Candidatus Eisenbacteria bacterium]MBU2689537.1 tryptophanase [Candidatus Eisenbacteria bacterium]
MVVHEPHKIKTVRLLSFPTLADRKKFLSDALFNVWHLTPTQVTFDMCSLGMSAVSQEQLSGQLIGDEAYAGSRNFEALQKAVRDVLGHEYVCPTHNVLGCVKLIVATMIPKGSGVPSNSRSRLDVFSPLGVDYPDVRDHEEKVFTGNIDLETLEEILNTHPVAFVGIQAFADGQHPFSLENLRAVAALAEKHGKKLICDGSRVIENAWYIQRHESGQADRPIAEIVKQIVKTTDVFQMDGAQDPKCNTGGLLTTDHPDTHEKFMNEVVVYEGLHTYGGMAGRTMEVLTRGIQEMCSEDEVHWVMQQTERFTQRLRDGGIPLERGCDGAYIEAESFLPHIDRHQQDTLAAAIYLIAGVRATSSGLTAKTHLLPVQIPRLAMTNEQLDQVADAIISLYKQRNKITGLQSAAQGKWRDQMSYHWVFPDLETYTFDTFPYEIHTIEKVGVLTQGQREKAIREAGYNTFLLRSADVAIDLLTDSGTTAMSTDQWAAYDSVRPSAAASDESDELVDILQETMGYEYIIPTHQGRAAEHILSQIMIKKGQYVPGNMYFTTTKLHQEFAGGIFVDVIVDEAHNTESTFPWKGNIDLDKLKSLVNEHGADKVAYISFEHSVNMAGGQPVGMDNMKEVYEYCSVIGIPVFFDATRFVENAYMIQKKDPRYADVKIKDILREMMLYGDGATISGKKDFLINIGGCLAFRNNEEWTEKALEMLRIYEGNITDGGLATADLAAIACGVEEMVDDRYIRSRVEQTQYLGSQLLELGIPIVTPPGSHAIFLDAKRFLPHLDQDEYPAQRLAAEIYVETGVRAMERGNVSKGRNPETGENYRPALELVRLTIPRRVYTNDHMREVARGVKRVWDRRESIKGLKFVYEPAKLRFFQGRFESK